MKFIINIIQFQIEIQFEKLLWPQKVFHVVYETEIKTEIKYWRVWYNENRKYGNFAEVFWFRETWRMYKEGTVVGFPTAKAFINFQLIN